MSLISTQISTLKLLPFLPRLLANSNSLMCQSSLRSSSSYNPLNMITEARKKAQIKEEDEDSQGKPKKVAPVTQDERPTARIERLRQKYKDNPAQLMEFFDDYKNWGEKEVKTGREWRVDELRLKSNQDIHKLWFILYKERNMLLTMLDQSRTDIELFPSPERLDRVEQSMLNIEEVVKERNKAYYDLEVGNGETGLRPAVFRRDLFGIHRYVSCSQHLMPYHLSPKYRNLYGPGFGKHVQKFVLKYREMRTRKKAKKVLGQWNHVRHILRRFPDVNMEELQALYPKVPVEYLKENLDYFGEREDIIMIQRRVKDD